MRKKEGRKKDKQRDVKKKKERKKAQEQSTISSTRRTIAKGWRGRSRTRRKTISRARNTDDEEDGEAERGMVCTTLYTCVRKHLSVYFNLSC